LTYPASGVKYTYQPQDCYTIIIRNALCGVRNAQFGGLRISAYGNAENWYYNFGENKRLFVYFMDGKVTMVRSKEDVEM